MKLSIAIPDSSLKDEKKHENKTRKTAKKHKNKYGRSGS